MTMFKNNKKLLDELLKVNSSQSRYELGMIRFDVFDVSSRGQELKESTCEYEFDGSYEMYVGKLPDEEFNKKYPTYMEVESKNAIVADVISCSDEDQSSYIITKLRLRNGKTVLIDEEFWPGDVDAIDRMKNYIIGNYRNYKNDVVTNRDDKLRLMREVNGVSGSEVTRYLKYDRDMRKFEDCFDRVLTKALKYSTPVHKRDFSFGNN